MSIKILVKRGLEADLTSAGVAAGELKFTTDTKKLYIGTGSENVQIGGDGGDRWGWQEGCSGIVWVGLVFSWGAGSEWGSASTRQPGQR